MKFCHTFSFFAVLIATVIVAQDYPENVSTIKNKKS